MAAKRKQPRARKAQSSTPLEKLSQRHHRFAELLAEGTYTRVDCYRRAGFSEQTINGQGGRWIAATREQSYYPALWDYFQQLRQKRLRLFNVTRESLEHELKLIGFSDITNYVDIPRRRDLERRALYAAEARRGFGYTDPEDEKLLAGETAVEEREKRAREASGEKRNHEVDPLTLLELMVHAPGTTIKLKAYEEIPAELRPAIAEISETRDGIKVKLHSKSAALDMMAKILKLYEADLPGTKPMTINSLNVIVKGSQSNLLSDLI